MNIFLASLIASLGINLFMFIPAFLLQTDKITDISYAVTFMFVALVAFLGSAREPFHYVLLFMVLAWAIRLGSFLLGRIIRQGKDKRFDGMREHFLLFGRFWLLQGISVFVVMISAVGGFNSSSNFQLISYLGIAVFLLGLILESVADHQKMKFSQISTNKNKWIQSGVWSLSRHPNYLGEMMIWSGVFLSVLFSVDSNLKWVGLISPLYIITLLLFVSGVPLLEKSADKKWGKPGPHRIAIVGKGQWVEYAQVVIQAKLVAV